MDTSIVTGVTVEDIRFRFGRDGSGSDAANPQTDYSNPYVRIETDAGVGVGVGFTLGRGNEMVCEAVRELAPIVVGRDVDEMVAGFASLWRELANPFQSRWIGPASGPYYMGAGALANAIFDLWAKRRGRPLWQALSALSPDEIVAMLDFRYVEHVLTINEAREILAKGVADRSKRITRLKEDGLPCYHTTWIGSSVDDLLNEIESVRAARGVSAFKLKIGRELEHDRMRLKAVREHFGDQIDVLVDANQVWSVPQAIEWMRSLAEFAITWIEEPTAPDLIDGHAQIRSALKESGIHVVTGENCPNSHVAAQLIAGGAVDRFQIDACRVIGPPEVILIMLVAAKYGVAICPHAGGSGLDELVPHLAAFNEVCIASGNPDVIVEQVGFCRDYFPFPSVVSDGRVHMPSEPGYIVDMKPETRAQFAYPDGPAWTEAG